MNFYFEIKLLANVELTERILMNEAYAQLHTALATFKTTKVGFSFPGYSKQGLGATVRLHSDAEMLSNLLEYIENNRYLRNLRDYMSITECLSVPTDCQYITFKRKQPSLSSAKIRRLNARGRIDNKQMQVMLSDQKLLKEPFIRLKSTSTNQRYLLFIQQGKVVEEPITGDFNTYGLSKNATVPWF